MGGSRGRRPVSPFPVRAHSLNDLILPSELTTLIGRGPELDQITELVERSRLVTLTGAGGSGKTRLALALVGRRISQSTEVHWIELAALRDATLLVPAIAEGLGRSEELGAGGEEALARTLRGHHGMIVLDNCEHLVETCARVVDRLLRECPGVRVLATSREALGVPGERAWLVPPLGVPEEGGGPSGRGVGAAVPRAGA
jgi:predicted ATPase